MQDDRLPSLPRLRARISALALAFSVSSTGLGSKALASPPNPTEHTPLATATQLGMAFSRVAEQVSPSVVSIQVEVVHRTRPPGFFFPFGPQQEDGVQRGSGSGLILAADGAVLTNNHVVENAARIEVSLQDGRRFPARVVGVDAATDLAVLRIGAKGLPAVHFADSDRSQVGQWVVAIGSPFGLDYTVTAGVLSAKGRGGIGANEIEDYLQTDASINPGNSGGPLVNLHGEVLGINTMIIGRASGIGFAIPSNLARRVATELLEKGDVKRAWIGVSYQELTPELAGSFGVQRTRGALVNDVVPGGPAAQAGLRSGDIVLDVGGREVREGRDLLRGVLQHTAGAKIGLTVVREGQTRKLTLVTAERPDAGRPPSRTRKTSPQGEPTVPQAGLQLVPLTPAVARRLSYAGDTGVVVASVAPGSIAERAGLMRGDVIEQVNRRPVHTPKQVEESLRAGRALLKLQRQGSTFFVALSPPEG